MNKQLYDITPTLCAQCNSSLPFNKRRNKFCSKSCSATFNNKNRVVSDVTKKRISKSIRANRAETSSYESRHFVCRVCNVAYCSLRHYPRKNKVCSIECLNEWRQSKERSDKLRQLANERVQNGTHVGWARRDNLVPSYPEQYFINLFDKEGIKYEREVKCDKFFIDFVIDNIAVEIDGKQHTYPEHIERDRRKDVALVEAGYVVFRIPWVNPTTDRNRSILYSKIDELKKIIGFNQ